MSLLLPSIRLESPQGEEIELPGAPPAPRLIVVYRCDCESCMVLLPTIERLSRVFHGKGLTTLGLSQDDLEATEDVIAENGLCFQQALDKDLELSRALAVEVVPTVLLVDAEGRVVERVDAIERGALERLVHAAGSLCNAEPSDLSRALERLSLPDDLPATPSRTREPQSVTPERNPV